ncbi:hypothetical protein ACX40Y_16810 [Sphingomonas sp. RS6]
MRRPDRPAICTMLAVIEEAGSVNDAMIALALAFAAPPADAAADRIGETCTGTETVRVGNRRAQLVPYTLDFSADLKAQSWCYGGCGPHQTFAIARSDDSAVQLADVNAASIEPGDQRRSIRFDRRSNTLTDDQSMDLGRMGSIIRHATARCRASAFHAPAALLRLKRP